jgi:hypothetical protein
MVTKKFAKVELYCAGRADGIGSETFAGADA